MSREQISVGQGNEAGRFRKRSLRLLLVVGLVVVVLVIGAVVGFDHSHSGPKVSGTRLYDLLQTAHPEETGWEKETGVSYAFASETIREFGSNAVPFLLRLMAEPNKWPLKERLREQLGNAGFYRLAFALPGPVHLSRAEIAERGFYLIGSNGWSAVPELERIARSDREPNGLSAVTVMAKMGGPGHRALGKMLGEAKLLSAEVAPILMALHEARIEDELLIAQIGELWSQGDNSMKLACLSAMQGIQGHEDLKARALEHSIKSSDRYDLGAALAVLLENEQLVPKFLSQIKLIVAGTNERASIVASNLLKKVSSTGSDRL